MSVLETPQQLQPHVSIYISLDLTVQLSKTKLILSLIGLEHPGSGPQHFTSAALHLPHCLPAPNSPALGSMSSTWLDIIIESSEVVRSLLCQNPPMSHIFYHMKSTPWTEWKKALLTLPPWTFPASAPASNSCTRCSKSKRPLKGPSTPSTVSQTPVILKTLVTHARQPSFCPCYLLNSTHSF